MQTSSYEAQVMARMLIEERRREADRQRLLRQAHSARSGSCWYRVSGFCIGWAASSSPSVTLCSHRLLPRKGLWDQRMGLDHDGAGTVCP